MICIYAGKSISASEPLVLHSLLSSQSCMEIRSREYIIIFTPWFLQGGNPNTWAGKAPGSWSGQAGSNAGCASKHILSLHSDDLLVCSHICNHPFWIRFYIICGTSLLAQFMQLILILLSQTDFLNGFGYVFKQFRGWLSAFSSPCANYWEGFCVRSVILWIIVSLLKGDFQQCT